MSEDEFTKLFKYVQGIGQKIDNLAATVATKDSMNHLTTTIDGFLKRLDDIEIEQTVRDAQFDRLLEWAREVSKKTGIPLPSL